MEDGRTIDHSHQPSAISQPAPLGPDRAHEGM
jgi:hypothetical protein